MSTTRDEAIVLITMAIVISIYYAFKCYRLVLNAIIIIRAFVAMMGHGMHQTQQQQQH